MEVLLLESRTMRVRWTGVVPLLAPCIGELAKVRSAGRESGPTMKIKMGELVIEALPFEDSPTQNGERPRCRPTEGR